MFSPLGDNFYDEYIGLIDSVKNVKRQKKELTVTMFLRGVNYGDSNVRLLVIGRAVNGWRENYSWSSNEDIDVNKHANNCNYIIWALETLTFEERTRKIKTLDVNYKKEITYGETVVSQVEIKENQTNHVLKNAKTDDVLCSILIEWE